MVLEPHLHLMVEVREQGPQLSSWHNFSHRWMVSEINNVETAGLNIVHKDHNALLVSDHRWLTIDL